MNSRFHLAEFVTVRHRWILHVAFWLVITLLYGVFFGRRNSNYAQTFFFVGLLMPVTIASVYFLNYYLLPRYLMQGRYAFFILYFSYLLGAALFLEMMIAFVTFLVMADADIRGMSPASTDIFFMLISLLMVILFALAIKLLLYWRGSVEDRQQLMNEKVAAELKFLKGQLNPHFLFNTLNNLYYLTSEKSDRAPRAILQLSEMLDYVMRSGKEMAVPLMEELRQVKNYIALEMLRYEGRVNVSVETQGPLESQMIGPMLIVTLVENAFKHGVMPTSRPSWINVAVVSVDGQLEIQVSNSVGTTAGAGKGIGMENLKRQLQYLYPSKHELQVSQTEGNAFHVQLLLRQ